MQEDVLMFGESIYAKKQIWPRVALTRSDQSGVNFHHPCPTWLSNFEGIVYNSFHLPFEGSLVSWDALTTV